jgi:methylated-DNA-[protein]-cysteine S-methyltransferase
MEKMTRVYMDSPIGKLRLEGDAGGLQAIEFVRRAPRTRSQPADRDLPAPVREAKRQLQDYFAGKRQDFDLPMSVQGTAFQLAVWKELQKIPYGQTISYGELARRIGRPKAVRAVGAANGCNPLPIVVPCHRVIGSNGKLTGYGGGIGIKKRLLALEGARVEFD